MSKEKLIKLFVECFDNSELSSKIEIHNNYVMENDCGMEDKIEINDEEFFDTFFEGKPMEAVRAVFYGDYRYNDEYVWFNVYGNLESGDYEEQLPLRDAEEMAEWYMENPNQLQWVASMGEFCNAC